MLQVSAKQSGDVISLRAVYEGGVAHAVTWSRGESQPGLREHDPNWHDVPVATERPREGLWLAGSEVVVLDKDGREAGRIPLPRIQRVGKVPLRVWISFLLAAPFAVAADVIVTPVVALAVFARVLFTGKFPDLP